MNSIHSKQPPLNRPHLMATAFGFFMSFGAANKRSHHPQQFSGNQFDLTDVAFSSFVSFGLIMILSMLMPGVAMADFINPANNPSSASIFGAVDDPITMIFKKLVGWASGTIGKAICTIAIIVAGIATMLGKISWGQGLIIAAGMALVFGATSVVNMVAGGGVGQAPTATALICTVPFSIPGIALPPVNPICGMVFNLVSTIQSELGAGIGSLSVVILGLAALFGKVSYPQAAILALGIALVFGAVGIVDILWATPKDCNQQVGGIIGAAATAAGAPGATAGSIMAAIMGGVTPEFVMCQFMDILQGRTGKLIATMGVIIMGFLSMIGRVSWQYALTVMCGIAAVFGSTEILAILFPASVAHSCSHLFSYTFNLGSAGAIEKVLCSINTMITGPVGKALASCAVIMLGFGAMVGKVSYSAAFVVAVGVAITFGAPGLVMYLTLAPPVCLLNVTASTPTPCAATWFAR
jgi:type IV secretory pathway VirB2 component (pilin)